MKLFKKLSEKGFEFFQVSNYHFLRQQIIIENKQSFPTSVYDLEFNLIENKNFQASPSIHFYSNNRLYIIDENEKKINLVSLEDLQIFKSYHYFINTYPVLISDEEHIVLKSDDAYIMYNYVNNIQLWKVQADDFVLTNLFQNYIIFLNLRNYYKLTNINLKEGKIQWELNFENPFLIKEIFSNQSDYEKYSKQKSTKIRGFEIFDNKVIIRFKELLLAVEIETGICLWVNNYRSINPSFPDTPYFKIDADGLLYLLDNGSEHNLKTLDINTGEDVWRSEIDWFKQSERNLSLIFSDFTMNEKYIFTTNVPMATILVIEKSTGKFIEEMPVFGKKQKRIWGVVAQPQIFQNKLLQLIEGELFVFDISEYI